MPEYKYRQSKEEQKVQKHKAKETHLDSQRQSPLMLMRDRGGNRRVMQMMQSDRREGVLQRTLEKQVGPSCWINVIAAVGESAGVKTDILKLGLLLYPRKDSTQTGREYYMNCIEQAFKNINTKLKSVDDIDSGKVKSAITGEIRAGVEDRFINKLKTIVPVGENQIFEKTNLTTTLQEGENIFAKLKVEVKGKTGNDAATHLLGSSQQFGTENDFSTLKDAMDSMSMSPPFYLGVTRIPNYQQIKMDYDTYSAQTLGKGGVPDSMEVYAGKLHEKKFGFVTAAHALLLEEYDVPGELFWIRDPNSPNGRYRIGISHLEDMIEKANGGFHIRFFKQGSPLEVILGKI